MNDSWSNTRSPIFHKQTYSHSFGGMLLGAFFLDTTVSAATKMLTDQQPLQTSDCAFS